MNNEIVKRVILKKRFLAILASQEAKKRQKRKRRWWVRPLHKNRPEQGDWENLIQEIRESDEEKFFEYTRLSVEQFDYLLDMIKDRIKKSDRYRSSIPPGARLAITLRYLATGDSLSSLSFAFRVGKSTACCIIKETCEVLWEILAPKYIKFPSGDEWKVIAKGFEEKWNLSHCVGSIDGKHCVIQAPNNSGSQYYNYKKNFSIVLFAICDENYVFTYADIGAYGSQSDGGVLRESTFGQKLFNNELKLPPAEILPGTNMTIPYFFVGDEAFPLHTNLLRPYGGHNLDNDKRIFNYRLSRARRCIENAFGIMVSRFRVFHRTINAHPETVDSIIKAAVCLHNFIKIEDFNVSVNRRRYSPPGYVDTYDATGNLVPGNWRKNIPPGPALCSARQLRRRIGTRNINRNAGYIRDLYKNYVNSQVGAVPWQNDIL